MISSRFAALIFLVTLGLPLSGAMSAEKDIYRDLRQMVFDLAKNDHGGKPANSEFPLAVLMETDLREGSYTLMVAGDGSTSLYTSNGGGVLGAGGHASVREQSKAFLRLARKYRSLFKKTSDRSLPGNEKSKFYIVEKGAVFVSEEFNDEKGVEAHPLYPLFNQAHKVIGAIRRVTPDAAGQR